MAQVIGDAAAIALNASLLLERASRYASAQARAAGRLARQSRELERSNLELEAFARAVSHDLRQPLHVVAGYAEMLALRLEGSSDQDVRGITEKIMLGVGRMNGMIEALLELARIDTSGEHVGEVDCEVVVSAVMRDLSPEIDAVSARVELGDLPVVRGRAGHVEQLMRNIVGNALKFTAQRQPQLSIRCVAEPGAWHFVFTDDGVGVPSDQREAIFEPFTRGELVGAVPGTGIGLALCRKIVQQHGGRIWVEAVEPTGSAFHFTIAR